MQRHRVVGLAAGVVITIGYLAYAGYRYIHHVPSAPITTSVAKDPPSPTSATPDVPARSSRRRPKVTSAIHRQTTPESHARIIALAERAAARYGLPETLVAAVISVESEFNPRAVSHRGALGLMQLMPRTAAVLGVRDAFDPTQNVDAGARHLRDLLNRFHDLPIALAAYNAGAQAVIQHGGVPPYPETRAFVARVMSRLGRRPMPVATVLVASPAATSRRIRVAARLTPNGVRHEPDLVVIPAVAAVRHDEPRVARGEPVVIPARAPKEVAVSASVVTFPTPERVESP